MITERVSWVEYVRLVQCNLDIKFCDIDSKSELWCVYICAGVGVSEQPTMNKTFPLQPVLLKNRISSGEMNPALRKSPHLTLSTLVWTTELNVPIQCTLNRRAFPYNPEDRHSVILQISYSVRTFWVGSLFSFVVPQKVFFLQEESFVVEKDM